MTQRTVVCIEDDPQVIDLLKLILGRLDISFVGAMGGRQGLEMVRDIRPDLVLLDLMMPDLDGWAVLRFLRADDQLKDIPVIILTVRAQKVDVMLGRHVFRAHDYITKPFQIQQLLDAVSSALGVPAGEENNTVVH